MRTVIYARFSSALQNSRSIEDQVRICRERCEREGWELIAEPFTDYATSGAAGIDENARPGLWAMLRRVEEGGVDQVLTEATDRIARHQGDAFTIRERINFAGARLFTLSDGEVTDIIATVRGLTDAQFRKDNRAKIKRGQRGTLEQGRSPGGKAYGYRLANIIDPDTGRAIRGLREVDEVQADVVRRIFSEYATGQSARAIASRLNEDRIPGPRGGVWNQTTIQGDRQRSNGMLQNRIYIGKLVHDRTEKILNPTTRKHLIRPLDRANWVEVDAPHLRIVDDATFDAVQERRQQYATHRPERSRRPKHILSGLTFCGVCGGSWTVRGGEYWGCGRHRESGPAACSNNRTARSDTMAERVEHGLTSQLLHPDAIEAYVREYHQAAAKKAKTIARDAERLKRAKREATAKIDRLVDAIAKGVDLVEVREALEKAREERDQLAADIADMESLPVIALHPTAAADYRREVEHLFASLSADTGLHMESIAKLRGLIGRIDIFPADTGRGTRIEVTARMNAMLALATGQPVPQEIAITWSG